MNILITGSTGRLGSFLKKYFNNNYFLLLPSSNELNICIKSDCDNFFQKNNIDLVIHCAALTNIILCEKNIIECVNTNVVGTINLLNNCIQKNIKIVYISTDHVFDGNKGNYGINDPINPITNYAKSKASAELLVRMYKNSLCIRTSFFGEVYPYDKACTDQYSTKDYIDIIAPKIFEQCMSNNTGVVHVFSKKRKIFDIAKDRKKDIQPCLRSEFDIYVPYDTSLV